MDDENTTDDGGVPAGEEVSFPFDRMTVEQFRARFPRARWSDTRNAWFVPGKTAARRVGRWLAELEADADAYADAKGRDAFEFDPIESAYLELGKAGFRIKTPYSRTVVDELRQIPFSQWDGDLKIWHIPYRSYEELRKHWPAIQDAARRSEPEERRRRAEERKGTEEDAKAKLRSAERKRRRLPLSTDHFPPIGRVVATSYGLVVFTEITGEIVDPEIVAQSYPAATDDHVWGLWRLPTLAELVAAWPAKTPALNEVEWWQPTIEELRPARRAARNKEDRKLRNNGAP